MPSSANSATDLISESASVEAGLVFIPTTILFLLVLQLIVAGSWQAISNAQLDSYVTRAALSGDESTAANSGREIRMSNERLPFGGEIIVAEATTKIPIISTFIGNLLRTRSVSIAVK